MNLRVTKGFQEGKTCELISGFSVGRELDNHLVLEDDGVSRYHCRFYRSGEAWQVEDMGSTNGIKMNGRKVEGKQPLSPGDSITVGGCEMSLFEEQNVSGPAGTHAGGPVLSGEKSSPKHGVSQEGGRTGHEGTGTSKIKETSANAFEEDEDESEGIPALWSNLIILLVALLLIGVFAFAFLEEYGEEDASENSTEGTAQNVESVEQVDEGGQRGTEKESLEGKAGGEQREGNEAFSSSPKNSEERFGGDREGDPKTEDGSQRDTEGFGEVDLRNREDAKEDAEQRSGQVSGNKAPLVLKSIPSGADIMIDEEKHGTTPASVEGVSRGRHRVVLKKPGFADKQRFVHVPTLMPEEPYKLEVGEGNVRLISDPEHVTVISGNTVLGRTPLLLTSLKNGKHKMRFIKYGYRPKMRPINVSDSVGITKKIQLDPLYGRLRIQTRPPGCDVYVDDFHQGRTKARENTKKNNAAPLIVKRLLQGKHRVKVTHPQKLEKTRVVNLEPGESKKIFVKLWVLDTKVVLNDGATRFGMFLYKNEFGDVFLAEPKVNRYVKENVKKRVSLATEEAIKIREKFNLYPDDEDDKEADEGELPEGGKALENMRLEEWRKAVSDRIDRMGVQNASNRTPSHENCPNNKCHSGWLVYEGIRGGGEQTWLVEPCPVCNPGGTKYPEPPEEWQGLLKEQVNRENGYYCPLNPLKESDGGT